MRKQTNGDAADSNQTPPVETPPAETPAASMAPSAPVEITDAAATEGEQHFDPNHEWPSEGGCYVRQEDGTLKRED